MSEEHAAKTAGEPSREEGRLIDVRCLIAVCASFFSTFVQNSFVYPFMFADIAYAMPLCGLIYGAAFGAWAFIAHRRKKPLSMRKTIYVACAAIAIGCLLRVAGGFLGSEGTAASTALLFVAVAFYSCGRAWVLIMTGISLGGLRPRGVLVTTAAGVCLAYAAFAVLGPAFSPFSGLIVYTLLPFLAVAAVAKIAIARREAGSTQEAAPNELALTNPGSFPGPFNRLFICIFLFEVAFGFSLRFGSAAAMWQQSAAGALALFAVALWCAKTTRAQREDTLFHLSALLVVFGFCASLAQTALMDTLSKEALALGGQVFHVLTWVTLSLIAARNPHGSIVALGQGFCALNMGTLAGVVLSQVPHAGGASPDIQSALIVVVVVAFVGFMWIAFGSFSFTTAIQDVKPVPEAAPRPTSTETDLAKRCELVVAAFGLTEREGEILALLARGRNGAYIQEEYRITRNTAKTHIRHIYQKLQIHTQQELIDLVEKAS